MMKWRRQSAMMLALSAAPGGPYLLKTVHAQSLGLARPGHHRRWSSEWFHHEVFYRVYPVDGKLRIKACSAAIDVESWAVEEATLANVLKLRLLPHVRIRLHRLAGLFELLFRSYVFSAYGLTNLGTGLGWICLLELLELRDCSNELGIILWLRQKERRSGEYTIFQENY
jgi:hypothetical protein